MRISLTGCSPGPSKKPKLSAIEEYQEYLKSIYNVRQLSADEKCPLGCVKHFVNLECADISNHLNRKQIEESWEMIVKGEMGSVPREKITIGQIACKIGDSFPKLVLIKGAPGVGKTTLSWELCRRWSGGDFWTDYSLVILLQLRDENIQKATRLVELFQCKDAGISEDIQYELSQGHGVLFILEGLDELPQVDIQDKDSIFVKLITGYLLPASTVLITTRPWAVSDLPKKCSSRLDQLIEILGFTEDQVKEYVSTMISTKEAPAKLQTYLDAHPHIRSAMYNPLYARIVVEVFRDSKNSFKDTKVPNTTTELYTTYSQILIERHLADHPVGEEWNGNLRNLPQSLQPQFSHLCEIAYQGTTKEKQQLVFFKEEIPNASDTLGFMNCVHPLYQQTSRKFQPSYNFIHLTLQEFLAAVHIWINHSEQEQLILFETQKRNGLYKMILLFLAGLTQFKDPWTRCVLPVPQNSKNVPGTKVCSYSTEFIIWLYESQNEEILSLYNSVMLIVPWTRVALGGMYQFTRGMADKLFFLALGYVIALGKFNVKIELSDFDDYSLDFVEAGLKVSRPCSSTLKHLSIHSQYLTDVKLASLLQCFKTPVEALHISNCKDALFSESLPLFNHIRDVKQIELDNLSSGIVKWLKDNTKLKRLKINSASSRLNFQELSSLIKASQSLNILLELEMNFLFSWTVCQVTFGLNAISMKSQAFLCSDFFLNFDISNYFRVDSDNTNSFQEAVIRSLENFSSDLKYFVLKRPETLGLDILNSESLFQAIFACPKLQSFTIEFNQGLITVSLDESVAMLSRSFIELALISHIFRALQGNTSVKILILKSLHEIHGINVAEFGSLLQRNTSLVEIEVQFTTDLTAAERDALVVMLEHVANATHLKKFSIQCPFDFSTNISLAVCKILERNSTLQHLKIPMFSETEESCILPIIRALSHSTLQSLIFEHTSGFGGQVSGFLHSKLGLGLELSNEVAKGLGEMLLTNKSLRTFHFPASFPDYSPIVRGLANNNIIEVFLTNASAKRRIMECSDYPCVWSKIIFDAEFGDVTEI